MVIHPLGMSIGESDDDAAEAVALRETLRRSEDIERGVVRPVLLTEAVERLRAGLRR